MEKYRRGSFATYLSQDYSFYETDKPNIFELVDRNYQFDELKKIGFLKYDEKISYVYVQKESITNAFYVVTYVKYLGFSFFLENIFEGKFILRPLEEAMKHFKDYPKQGYDPVYEATEEEITDIWEERTPIKGFKFDIKPIQYIKKDGKYLE